MDDNSRDRLTLARRFVEPSNSTHRQYEALRAFFAKEFAGDHVTMEVREVVDHYGDVIVRARFDGTYDKTNLPDELVMTSYFGLREGQITSLAVIFNQPSPY